MAAHNYLGSDEGPRIQRARLTDWTWEEATVIELTGKVAKLFTQIPLFSRDPLWVGSEENRFKDEIRWEPHLDFDPGDGYPRIICSEGLT